MIFTLLGLWLSMLIAGDTPTGRMMRRWSVEKPAERLSRIHRRTVLAVMVMVALGGAAVLIMGHDGIQIFGMAAPELTSMLAMIDLGVVLDAAVLAIAAASMGSLRGIHAVLRRMRSRPRTARARRTRRPERRISSNDDEHPAGLALAA